MFNFKVPSFPLLSKMNIKINVRSSVSLRFLSSMSILLFCFISFRLIHSGGSSLIQITDSNWEQVLEGDEWMIEFFAPWCPACRHLNPIWEDFSTWSSDLGIKIGQIDITKSPGLSGRFMITALPTIYHVKDGKFRQYRGSRTKDDFLIFIEEKRWETIDPISSLYSPSSYLMAAVSGFYQLSMEMRNLLNVMTETYGFPVWVTYALCGLTTILIGLLLGMILVFCIDFFYPQRPSIPRRETSFRDKGAGDGKDESDDGDIIDDISENSNNITHDDKGDRKKDQ